MSCSGTAFLNHHGPGDPGVHQSAAITRWSCWWSSDVTP